MTVSWVWKTDAILDYNSSIGASLVNFNTVKPQSLVKPTENVSDPLWIIFVKFWPVLFIATARRLWDVKPLKSTHLSVLPLCSVRAWEEVTAPETLRAQLWPPGYVPVTAWHLPVGSVLANRVKQDWQNVPNNQGSGNKSLIITHFMLIRWEIGCTWSTKRKSSVSWLFFGWNTAKSLLAKDNSSTCSSAGVWAFPLTGCQTFIPASLQLAWPAIPPSSPTFQRLYYSPHSSLSSKDAEMSCVNCHRSSTAWLATLGEAYRETK